MQVTEKWDPRNLAGFEVYENSCNGLPLPYIQGVNVLPFIIHKIFTMVIKQHSQNTKLKTNTWPVTGQHWVSSKSESMPIIQAQMQLLYTELETFQKRLYSPTPWLCDHSLGMTTKMQWTNIRVTPDWKVQNKPTSISASTYFYFLPHDLKQFHTPVFQSLLYDPLVCLNIFIHLCILLLQCSPHSLQYSYPHRSYFWVNKCSFIVVF